MCRVLLSHRAEKALEGVAPNVERARERLESLGDNPRISGTKKLENMRVAQYRHRVGDCRILFDVDEQSKIVKVLDIRRRGERTYK